MHSRFLLLWLLLFAPMAWAGPSAPDLAKEMGTRMMRVPEFEFIRQEAKKLGVRVYLFGGTAAAYGHYVRQDMAREAGDTRYPGFLYDYDYTNIFRSTQDLDVVIDGPADKASALEVTLKGKFPHFVGDKAAKWEVRSLREARGDKEAILDNPDFQNQHTDSHSTGLVEITETPASESPVKDVRDWAAKEPQFLQDVADSKLHYYFNPKHGSTARAAKGMNPPILSAIRYLTKAFQYDLEISGEDRKKIREVIQAFDPKSVQDDYVKKWIEKNGKKLFQHAVDIEYAWNELEDLGLREKLIGIQNNPHTVESLSWWMSKEPLRTQPVGRGRGKTAAEIFGKNLTFSHETNSFLAYESITRSKAGELNGLISRKQGIGESAALGDGFYARQGRTGARGTGITIRMELDPKAREGTDFSATGDFIVLKNKAAVKVRPEQIELSIPEYLKLLGQGKEFSEDDKALLEAFKRRIRRNGVMSAQDEAEIVQYMKSSVGTRAGDRVALWNEWLNLPLREKHPEIVEALIERGNANIAVQYLMLPEAENNPKWIAWVESLVKRGGGDSYLATFLLTKPRLRSDPRWAGWVDTLIERKEAISSLASNVFSDAQVMNHPKWGEWIDATLKDTSDDVLAEKILSKPEAMKHPKFDTWMDLVLSRDTRKEGYIGHVLSKPELMNHPKWKNWVGSLIEKARPDLDQAIAWPILANPTVSAFPEWEGWVDAILKRESADSQMISDVLKQAQAMNHPKWQKWVTALFNKYAKSKDSEAFTLIGQPYAIHHPKWTSWMDRMLKSRSSNSYMARRLLGNAEVVKHPKWAEWLKFVIDRGDSHSDIAYNILAKPEVMAHSQWAEMMDYFLKKKATNYSVAQYVLSQPEAMKHPEWISWVKKVIKGGDGDAVGAYVLSSPEAKSRPEWGELMDSLIARNKITDEIVKTVLTEPYPPELAEAMKKNGIKTLTASDLKKLAGAGFTFGQSNHAPRNCGGAFAGLLQP